MALKRLNKEYKDLNDDPHPNFTIERNLKNTFECRLVLNGPKDTPYEGGVFYFKILFPKDYPFSPFHVQVLTDMYHPQVQNRQKNQGYSEFCCCVSQSLTDTWSPYKTLRSVFNEILTLMVNPDFENLCLDIEFKGKKHDEEFINKAKDWTLKYAM